MLFLFNIIQSFSGHSLYNLKDSEAWMDTKEEEEDSIARDTRCLCYR